MEEKNVVLLATIVNILKDYVDMFNEKLYILVKKYEEENNFTNLSSNFEVTDQIMSRFKVYKEISE